MNLGPVAGQFGPDIAIDLDRAPFVTAFIGDDLEECRMPVKETFALYIGGMGRATRTSTTTTPSAWDTRRPR